MADQRINVNTADVMELTGLPGIGPVLARRIVAYRQTVHPYERPADITAVTGIGETRFSAIADRLIAVLPEGLSPASDEESERQERGAEDEELADEEKPAGRAELVERAPPEDQALDDADASPLGQSTQERRRSFKGDVDLPAAEVASPQEADEAASEVAQRPEENKVAASPEEEPAQPDAPGEDVPTSPPSDLADRVTRPRRPWSWLWIAVAGGLLGMVFSLVVFAGINGSLDVGHTRAVLDIKGDVNALTTDLEGVSANLEGLRRRLDALEGLTTRMDRVESSVDELRQETSDLRERTTALEEGVDALSGRLQAVSDDVAALQQEAERTRSFFNGLQGLLNEVFGETDSQPSPTPTPKGK
ncbi:MAG: helix-hairpin-helix domain-containing protein [Anaerolineae bacterium]